MKSLLQIFKIMEKSEYFVLIKRCFLIGKKANNDLISVIRTLLRRKQRLRGGMLTRSYRHKRCWTLRLSRFGSCPGKHQKLPKLFSADPKLTFHEIAEEMKISESSVFTLLHEHLSMREMGFKCAARFLLKDQKQQRVDDSECCL